ncbi:MAG: hypothetical protein AAF548_03820 [Actinomycetota bacterium]
MGFGIDRARLARHVARVDGLFDAARGDFTHWVDTDAGRRLLATDADALYSATIAAASHRIESDPEDVHLRAYLDAEWVTERMLRRRWQVEPADAVLMLALAADERCWYYEIRVALHLAERALDEHPGNPDVLEALEGLRGRLKDDRLHTSDFFSRKVGPWLNRLLADHSPGGLVDLTFIDDRGSWGAVARVAVAHAMDTSSTAAPFILHLAQPRGSRASAAWWAQTARHMATADADLVRELAEAMATVAPTPGDPAIDGFDAPADHLVVPNNLGLARGVVWAQRHAPDRAAPDRLGRILARSAQPGRGGGNRLARAAARTLAERGDEPSSAELAKALEVVEGKPLRDYIAALMPSSA